jgi:murein DD-endopeptidase MepM/ murein hydrolase activator NlpD
MTYTTISKSVLVLCFIVVAAPPAPCGVAAEPPDGQVIVTARHVGPADELTDEQRREIWERLRRNIASLEEQGLLSEPPPSYLATHPTFDWPLATPTLSDPGYHYMVSFVDHNPSFPNALLDFACGTRTYDRSDGYNHQGSDFALFPFPWIRVEDGQVDIDAAAPGVIIGKDDGQPDHSCGMNPSIPWNAVYIQHADGSIAWYGHMKTGSTTTKAVGAAVARGETLGRVGSSGNSDRPHLHLEVYDSVGALNDPYQGACNNFNATGWWANQRPYTDPALNRAAVVAGRFFRLLARSSRTGRGLRPGDRLTFVAYYGISRGRVRDERRPPPRRNCALLVDGQSHVFLGQDLLAARDYELRTRRTAWHLALRRDVPRQDDLAQLPPIGGNRLRPRSRRAPGRNTGPRQQVGSESGADVDGVLRFHRHGLRGLRRQHR